MPRYKNQKKTMKYSNEFKTKAVQLSHMENIQVKDIAQALDIHPFMLSRWRKEFREGKIVADKRKKVIKLPREISENGRIRILEKENAKLKTENELLKKWQRFLAERKQSDLHS
jgi:transposase